MSFIFLKGNTISMIQHLKDRELSLFTLLYSHHPFFLYRWSLLPTAYIFSQRCSRQNKVIDNDWRISLIWADFLCSSILQSVGSRKFLSIKIDTPGFSVTICVRNIFYGSMHMFFFLNKQHRSDFWLQRLLGKQSFHLTEGFCLWQ